MYPALESTYFPDKEGARALFYLGGIYLIPGVLSLAFLWGGFRLPRLPPALVVPFRLPLSGDSATIMELLAVAVFLSVQIATIATRVELKFKPSYGDA